MTDNKLNLSKAGVSVDLLELKDGSYQINLLDKDQTKGLETQEVDVPQGEPNGRARTHPRRVSTRS